MESLPVEVISHILTFLYHGDQISLSLTAKHFYNAYHDPRVLKTVLVKFDNCRLDIMHPPLCIFAKSVINYQRLLLGAGIRDIVLNETRISQSFWIKFGYNIKELILQTPGNVGFKLVSKFMPNIRVLRIFNRGTRPINFGKDELNELKTSLLNVHTLEICSNYEQLEELLALLPALENLYLEGFSCKRTFTRNSSLSLNFLTQFITRVRALEMKGLLLHSYCVEIDSNEKFFYELASTTGLLLRTLACSIEGVPVPLLHQLFQNMQKSLKCLDLTSWVGISSEIYQIIFIYLKQLEQLTLRGRLTVDGLEHICNLKNLIVLRFIDSFENIEGHEVPSHFLTKLKNNGKLRELQIDTRCLNSQECLTCFYDVISDVNIAESLQILNVSKSMIDDRNISFLIDHAKNLKELHMSDCKNVTKFERTNVDFSKRMLQKLEILEISHCHKLTSQGLENLFYMKQLRHLFLNNVEAITFPIIQTLTENCPSLEKLSIANCQQITDQCIEFITHLHRLKHLDISGCKKLTKLTEYSLWKFRQIKTLHAVGLERLEMSIIMMFSKIPTLHLYRCDVDYTRVDFEAKKYVTKQKLKSVGRCLIFTQRSNRY